jgi:hypothetical protein
MRKICIALYYFILISVQFCYSQNVENTEYVQILVYGQSLGMGWQAPRAITTTPVAGNYMLGDSPIMMYNNNQAVLNPLVATLWSKGGEQPIVSCVNVFADMYRKNVNANAQFIAMTGGQGGRTIELLSKECTNGSQDLYKKSFLRILDNTLASLPIGKKVSCPAIIYMQGEHNSGAIPQASGGLLPGTDGTIDKLTYKQLLLQLKNNMQADIMRKYGQSTKPLFFIYQTSGTLIASKEMPIVMAQFEFAQENEDVVMVNPHYASPSYYGVHLSPNGTRMFGEKTGRVLYDCLVNGKRYETVHPTHFSVSGKVLTITYAVQFPPLVLDTWTATIAKNYGFAIYKDNEEVSIKNVKVENGNQIVISCSTDLKVGSMEVVYAGNTTRGAGNVCDSYSVPSMYTYYDDTADALKERYTPKDKSGDKLYGKNYPLQNWSTSFYQKIVK